MSRNCTVELVGLAFQLLDMVLKKKLELRLGNYIHLNICIIVDENQCYEKVHWK